MLILVVISLVFVVCFVVGEPCKCPPADLKKTKCTPGTSSGPVQAPQFVLQQSGQTAWFSGALVFDLDNDGQNELIACYYDVFVHRVTTKNDLSSLKQIWKSDQGQGRALAPCAVVDIDGDGTVEIVVARKNAVWAWEWKGDSATVKTGFPVNTDAYGDSELRGLGVRDLDGDGHAEIIASSTLGSNKPQMFAWSSSGSVYQPTCGTARKSGLAPMPHSPAWPRYNELSGLGNDEEFNGCGHNGYGAYGLNVAIGQLDDDPELEVAGSFDNHHIQVYDHDGVALNTASYFSNRDKKCMDQRLTFGQFIRYADPTVEENHYHKHEGDWPGPAKFEWLQFTQSPMNMVDLNQDGKNELVSVPNGELNIPYETQRYAAFVIEGAHGDGERAGMRLPGWEQLVGGSKPTKVQGYYPPTGPTSPVTCDVVGDSHPEILFDAKDGHIYCLSHDGKQLWKYNYASGHSAAAPMFASEPLVVDLNGDGVPEVVFSTFGNPDVNAGFLVVLDNNGKKLHEVEISKAGKRNGNGNGAPTVAAGDVDGDGQLELIAMTFEQGMQVFTVPGSSTNCMTWITSRGGRHRTGEAEDNAARDASAGDCFVPPAPTPAPVADPISPTPAATTTKATPKTVMLPSQECEATTIEQLCEEQCNGRAKVSQCECNDGNSQIICQQTIATDAPSPTTGTGANALASAAAIVALAAMQM